MRHRRLWEELKAFFIAHQIDEDKVRFFIGKDMKEPKCFGIYKNDNGDFVVYKNKVPTGQGRYGMKAQTKYYAVNELYMRLEQGFINQHMAYQLKHEPNGNPSQTVRTGIVTGDYI